MRAAHALFLISAFALPLPAPAFDESESVAQPDIKVGDYWLYRFTTSRQKEGVVNRTEVTFLGDDLILTMSESVTLKQEVVKELDGNWTAAWNPRATGRGFVYKPHAGVFRFPMKAGNNHETTFILETGSGRRLDSKQVWQVKVRGWEDIAVPAGTFRTLKIEVDGLSGVDDRGGYYSKVSQRIWYSPVVKRWVKSINISGPFGKYEEINELLEYRVQ